MRHAPAILAAALLLALPFAGNAGPVVDRIKAGNVIRCGGVSRPGLVGQPMDGGAASGLYLDLCRAIGAALLGPDGRIEFRPYNSDKAFDRMRDGTDDLAFLDGSEIGGQNLAGKIVPGPPVVFLSTSAMVPEIFARKKPRRPRRQGDLLLSGVERPPEFRGLDG